MKNLIFGALALITTFTLGSCNLLDDNSSSAGSPFSTVFNPDAIFSPCEDGVDASYSDLPTAAQDYIQENYPNWEVNDVDRYLESGDVRFGVELDSLNAEYELLFDENGTLISAGPDDDDTYISISDLPQEVLDYLEAEFPGMAIDEVSIDVEYGLEFFEVELYDDLEVYFSIDGVFACSENSDGNDDDDDDDDGNDDDGNDDDDDDDNGNDDDDDDDDDGNDDDDDDDDQVNNLPSGVSEFINSNYPGYQIDEAYLEEYCNNTNILEVEIEMGSQDRDLYFDLDGNFLFEGDDISTTSLPAAVAATLNAEYPGFQIDDAEILTLADGTVQYWVEVENDNDEDEYNVILTEDGNIVCSFED